MNKALLLGCVAVLALATARFAAADTPPVLEKWEYKAVAFGESATAATKLLNDLHEAGWEYVGPLANGLVAFRRIAPTTASVAATKERDKLQGTWATVSTELDGEQRAEDKKLEKVTFSNNKWTAKLDGEIAQEGVYKIVEVTDKFIKVDFTVTEGRKQGDTWISIILIEGDKMKWSGSYASDGKGRPKAFRTTEGDGYFLRTLRREK